MLEYKLSIISNVDFRIRGLKYILHSGVLSTFLAHFNGVEHSEPYHAPLLQASDRVTGGDLAGGLLARHPSLKKQNIKI